MSVWIMKQKKELWSCDLVIDALQTNKCITVFMGSAHKETIFIFFLDYESKISWLNQYRTICKIGKFDQPSLE